MKKSEEVLIAVLAAADALWEPHRKWTAGPVISQRRVLYGGSGLPWAVAKVIGTVPDSADRKAVRAALDALELKDLVVVGNPTGLRTTTIRLTDAGDDRARALVGLCHLADSYELLQSLRTLRDDPRGVDYDGMAWASEVMLSGVEWGTKDDAGNSLREPFAEVQCTMLPALCRGLVESRTSIKGHAWYALTTGGNLYVSKPEPAPPENLPRARDDCFATYLARLRQARAELASTESATIGDVGLIPFPVCPERRGANIAPAARAKGEGF
jgi:hypothetical protein